MDVSSKSSKKGTTNAPGFPGAFHASSLSPSRRPFQMSPGLMAGTSFRTGGDIKKNIIYMIFDIWYIYICIYIYPSIYLSIYLYNYLFIYLFIYHMVVSWNRGAPKTSIFSVLFPYRPSILGYPPFMETLIFIITLWLFQEDHDFISHRTAWAFPWLG